MFVIKGECKYANNIYHSILLLLVEHTVEPVTRTAHQEVGILVLKPVTRTAYQEVGILVLN